MINIGLIGCGFVSYYYCQSACNHSNICLKGVYDRNAYKSKELADKYNCKKYDTFDDLLNDCELIINATNPNEHFELNKKILSAGKHLYSEKPICLSLEQFEELLNLSLKKNVKILSAPATYLSNAFTCLKDNLHKIGKVRSIKAQMTEKNVPYHKISNPLGRKWNIHDEFKTGCNLEHAGYMLAILLSLFNGDITNLNVRKGVAKYAKELGDKIYCVSTPDIYKSNFLLDDINVTMTTSIVNDENRMINIYGDNGVLELRDVWDFNSPIYLNGEEISYENEHFKNDWELNIDLCRPIHVFEKDEKKVMDIMIIKKMLSLMLEIQDA